MVQKAQKVAPVPSLQFGPGPMAGRVMRLDSEDATLGRQDQSAALPRNVVSLVFGNGSLTGFTG